MLIFSSGRIFMKRRIYESLQSRYYKFTVTIMSFQLEGSFYFHMAFFFLLCGCKMAFNTKERVFDLH